MKLRNSFLAILCLAATATTLATLQSATFQSDKHKYSYALVGKDGHSFVNNWDGKDFWSARNKGKADTLYVRKDGKTYIITDRATIDQFKKAIEPVVKIGKKQGEIGARQGEIGSRQAKIGAKQGELGAKMGEIGAQMGELSTKRLSDAERDRQQEALERRMKSLNAEMEKLSGQMDEPNKKQEELSKIQTELGKQQEKASSEAHPKLERIIDTAFEKGLAKPEGN